MKKRLFRIIISFILFITAIVLNIDNKYVELTIYLLCYIVVGFDVIINAIKNIFRGRVFDENFLMSIATIGAFAIGEYPEGVAVMLFYQIGEAFQSYAVNKSRKSIADLMNIRPDYANVKIGDNLVKTDPEKVRIGDIIVVKPGEKIPLDVKIIKGTTMIDTSALTGESVPREVSVGNELLSGCINISGVITAEVTKEFEQSTVNKILDLVENSISKKSKSEQFITKFARVYTPIVVICAVILATVPPLFLGISTFSNWIYRALAFLVVSCPCALVVSVPLSFFGGIGGASKSGILIKGGNYLEALARTEIMVFDKTGTLTKGVFNVQKIHAIGISKEKLLELTVHAESYSNHPISLSLKREYGKDVDNNRISDVEELSGYGVKATVDGKNVLAGNFRLMKKMNIAYSKEELIGTIIHVAINNVYAGYIVIADELKSDSDRAIKELKSNGIKRTVMLTGDTENTGLKVAKELGIDKTYTQLLPQDKVKRLESIISENSSLGKVAFVGDGINDAPVLARADVGIAMGGLGSDAAIEAADIVILTDEPSKIVTAKKISQNTLKIANQNIGFSIAIKIAVLLLSSIGLSNLWEAVFADVGVTIIAILNSFRALNVKKL